MKTQKGITLISLIVYVTAMIFVVGAISILTTNFYSNIETLESRNEGAKQYTTFNSYLITDINEKNNVILDNLSTSNKIVFSNGNQYTYINQAIYFNKIKLCKDISTCNFTYNGLENKLTVQLVINGKSYNNEYTLKKDI